MFEINYEKESCKIYISESFSIPANLPKRTRKYSGKTYSKIFFIKPYSTIRG